MRKESNYEIMKHRMQEFFAQRNLILAAEKWHLKINDKIIYVRFIARDYGINSENGIILRMDNGVEADYNEAMILYDILSREPAVPFGNVDVGYKLPILQQLNVILQFWSSDDEFDPELKFMCDQNTMFFMKYETMMFMLNHLLNRLCEEMLV